MRSPNNRSQVWGVQRFLPTVAELSHSKPVWMLGCEISGAPREGELRYAADLAMASLFCQNFHRDCCDQEIISVISPRSNRSLIKSMP